MALMRARLAVVDDDENEDEVGWWPRAWLTSLSWLASRRCRAFVRR